MNSSGVIEGDKLPPLPSVGDVGGIQYRRLVETRSITPSPTTVPIEETVYNLQELRPVST